MTIVIKIGKAGMGGTVTCSTPYLIDDARVRERLLNDSSLPLLTDAPSCQTLTRNAESC